MISIIKRRKLYQNFLQEREQKIDHASFRKIYSKKLKSLKGIHLGEKCFIVGNGPSLTPEDLTLIKDEVSFASNFIYKMFDKTEWRPTYYCNSDLGVLDKILASNSFCALQPELFFFQYNSRFVFQNRPYPKNSICFYLRNASDYNATPRFSTDISDEIFDAYTVTYIMLQIAAYMGFAEIYLIGVDHNYSITIDNSGIKQACKAFDHFYKDSTETKIDNIPNVQRMTMGYESADRYSRKNGFRIFNATRGGKLEAFERKQLEDCLTK